MKHILIALLFAITQTSYSQYFVESKVNSLSIEENESLTFMGDTLVIDSLIMADNSALLFNKNAFDEKI